MKAHYLTYVSAPVLYRHWWNRVRYCFYLHLTCKRRKKLDKMQPVQSRRSFSLLSTKKFSARTPNTELLINPSYRHKLSSYLVAVYYGWCHCCWSLLPMQEPTLPKRCPLGSPTRSPTHVSTTLPTRKQPFHQQWDLQGVHPLVQLLD